MTLHELDELFIAEDGLLCTPNSPTASESLTVTPPV